MANEGLSALSTIMSATISASMTSTVIRNYGAELLFLYTKYVDGGSSTLTSWTVEVSDDNSTWKPIPLHTRSSLTTSQNWRTVVRCGSYNRYFRITAVGSGTDATGSLTTYATFNRNPRPVLSS